MKKILVGLTLLASMSSHAFNANICVENLLEKSGTSEHVANVICNSKSPICTAAAYKKFPFDQLSIEEVSNRCEVDCIGFLLPDDESWFPQRTTREYTCNPKYNWSNYNIKGETIFDLLPPKESSESVTANKKDSDTDIMAIRLYKEILSAREFDISFAITLLKNYKKQPLDMVIERIVISNDGEFIQALLEEGFTPDYLISLRPSNENLDLIRDFKL